MNARRLAGAATLAVLAPIAMITGPAQAAAAPVTSITASASDNTPASGQTFQVSGLFTAFGKPADHLTVKVQSLDNGSWVQLTGAQVLTHSDGTYGLRVILGRKGERDLRVVGIVPGAARDAFKRFEVTVH